MQTYWLCFRLCSDATFGRGEGLAGVVDQEIEHDVDGLPYLRGRALKGLLNEECANIRVALSHGSPAALARWDRAAQRLFGGPGSTLDDDALMRVDHAQLPAPLRQAVAVARRHHDKPITAADALSALTAIRRQTAVDEDTGAPDEHTLRSMRVVLRDTPFEARLTFADLPNGSPQEQQQDDLALLAACILGLRRAGIGRNRGRGRLKAALHADETGRPGADITRQWFDRFSREELS